MSQTDPIADLLTRIRNAVQARHPKVDVPSSRVKKSVVTILKDEGYIKNFKLLEDSKQGVIRIYFKPTVDRDENIITDLQRVSRPGLRVYVDTKNLPRVLGGLGTAVISTNKGVMTGSRASKEGVGGEHLFNVW